MSRIKRVLPILYLGCLLLISGIPLSNSYPGYLPIARAYAGTGQPTALAPPKVAPTQFANWAAWNGYMSHIPVPRAGCFVATYPSPLWQSTGCVTAPLIRLGPSTVGDGNDEVAQSSSTLIGSSFGSFQSVTGLTSETDSLQGPDYYTLQDNTNFFTTSTIYTGGKSTTGWEQFVFVNEPDYGLGVIFIQYWLINYQSDYGSCPSTGVPGGSSWYAYSGDCYANSPASETPFEPASNLANLVLRAYANIGSMDENLLCISSGSCYSMSTTDQVVNLYQNWRDAEFNVFGYSDGSQANFNSGTSITVLNSLNDQSGNAIAASCLVTGYTGETNNLNLGACSSNSGQIVFIETNGNTVTNTVTFNTNPTSFPSSSSPGSISACGGTFSNGQSSTNCGNSLSATADLPSPPNQWQFDHWEWSGGVSCSTDTANPTTCTISGSGSLQADYSAQITFFTNPSSQGSINWGSCSNIGQANGQSIFDVNLPPEFTDTDTACANVPSGYSFSGWSVSGGLSLSSPSSNPTTVTVLGPGTITATFSQTSSQTLFTGVDSGSGTVTPSCPSPNGCVETVGQQVTVTANPSSGWSFSSWSTQSGVSCSGNPCTLKMPNTQVTLDATFQTNVNPQVTTDQSTYAQDDYIQYSGAGFTPSGSVESCISVDNDGTVVCLGPPYTANADSQGDVSGTMQIGTNIPPGPQQFLMQDSTTGTFSNLVQITVTEPTLTATATQTVTETSTTTAITSSTATSETTTAITVTSTSTATTGQVCSVTTTTTSTGVTLQVATTTSSTETTATTTSTSATTTFVTSTSTSTIVTTTTVTTCSQTVTSTSTSLTQTTNTAPITLITQADSGSGTVTPDCSVGCSEEAGSPITVTANPNSGWQFSNWSTQNGVSCSSNPCTFTMPSNNVTLGATFTAAAQVTMTVSYSEVGGGSPSAPVFHYVLNGVAQSLTLTKTAKAVSVDTGSAWSVTPNPLGSSTSQRWYSTQALSGTASATTILFAFQHQYLLTMKVSGPGTTSPSSGWYNAGQKVTITATANSGHKFKSWKGNGTGNYTGTSSTHTITINAAITETANFI